VGRGARPDTPEAQLRHWYYVLPLSGDFIVEQSIHALDVATWIADADPISAVGTWAAGRCVPKAVSGTTSWSTTHSPTSLPLSFTSIQSIPGVKDEIRCRFFGADGVIDTDYFGTCSFEAQSRSREAV
jgi:predicted dehydrogenase